MQPQTKTAKERVMNHRRRMRAAGLKSVQIWVPNPDAPGFTEECRRQSSIIRQDPVENQDLEQFVEIADWGHE